WFYVINNFFRKLIKQNRQIGFWFFDSEINTFGSSVKGFLNSFVRFFYVKNIDSLKNFKVGNIRLNTNSTFKLIVMVERLYFDSFRRFPNKGLVVVCSF